MVQLTISQNWSKHCLGWERRQAIAWSTSALGQVLPVRDLDHYCDVIMGAMVPQITSLAIVYSTVHLGADQRKHQSSTSLAFVWGIHRWPVNSPHKGPVTRKMFPFDDVIMIYSTFQSNAQNMPQWNVPHIYPNIYPNGDLRLWPESRLNEKLIIEFIPSQNGKNRLWRVRFYKNYDVFTNGENFRQSLIFIRYFITKWIPLTMILGA